MVIDDKIHEFFDRTPDILWRDFKDVGIKENWYDYYYAESELYILRDRITEGMWFIEARSPKQALEILRERFHSIDVEPVREEWE